MIQLHAGNVLLKPSHRRQLLAWLRRATKMGERLGQFVLNVTLHRVGRAIEVRATVHDAAGDFACHTRSTDWRTAARDCARSLSDGIHRQLIARSLPAPA